MQNRSVKIWEQVWKTYIQTSRITDHRQQTTRRPKKEYDSRISTGGLQLSSAVSAHDQTVADYTAARETLQDTLMGQLAISGTSITHSKIATDIIDNLDPAGYLRTELPDIAERLGAGEDECEVALKLVQSFEPTGVGARSLEECLRLQLKDHDRLDPAIVSYSTIWISWPNEILPA